MPSRSLPMGVIDDFTIDDICVGHAKHDTIDPLSASFKTLTGSKKKGSENAALCFLVGRAISYPIVQRIWHTEHRGC
jgi:hypothetical protein